LDIFSFRIVSNLEIFQNIILGYVFYSTPVILRTTGSSAIRAAVSTLAAAGRWRRIGIRYLLVTAFIAGIAQCAEGGRRCGDAIANARATWPSSILQLPRATEKTRESGLRRASKLAEQPAPEGAAPFGDRRSHSSPRSVCRRLRHFSGDRILLTGSSARGVDCPRNASERRSMGSSGSWGSHGLRFPRAHGS
jgi:hypothetical protein